MSDPPRGAVRGLGYALALGLVSPDAARQAMEHEQTLGAGRALGLPEDQVREVIDAWVAEYVQHPDPLPWRAVRSALTLRAFGEEWRP